MGGLIMGLLHDYLAEKQAQQQAKQPIRSYYHYQQRRNKLNKERLEPISFYRQFGIQLKNNRTHGGYKCHACDVSGDMINFYMTYKGVDFITACNELEINS